MTNVRSTSGMVSKSERPLEEYIRDSHVEEEFYLPLLFMTQNKAQALTLWVIWT